MRTYCVPFSTRIVPRRRLAQLLPRIAELLPSAASGDRFAESVSENAAVALKIISPPYTSLCSFLIIEKERHQFDDL
jgi:hypothetical protein